MLQQIQILILARAIVIRKLSIVSSILRIETLKTIHRAIWCHQLSTITLMSQSLKFLKRMSVKLNKVVKKDKDKWQWPKNIKLNNNKDKNKCLVVQVEQLKTPLSSTKTLKPKWTTSWRHSSNRHSSSNSSSSNSTNKIWRRRSNKNSAHSLTWWEHTVKLTKDS